MTRIGREQEKCVQTEATALIEAWSVVSDIEGDLIHAQSAHRILGHLLDTLVEDGKTIRRTEGGRCVYLTNDEVEMIMHSLGYVEQEINGAMATFRKGHAAMNAARGAGQTEAA